MLLVLAVVVAGAVTIAMRFGPWSSSDAAVQVAVPALSPLAQTGADVFARNCASCHGAHAAGGSGGPPLVHPIYNPGHHGDAAFLFAVRRGVRQHHWRFGNMPPQPQVADNDVVAIVHYVRELQAANGIRNEPHRMQ